MNAEQFSALIREIMALPPAERHIRMLALHKSLYSKYAVAIERVTSQDAASPLEIEGETRTLAQVVGHITEWERYIIMGAGDILAGIEHPRMVTSITGYREPDGSERAFESIDHFNAYQAEKHRATRWDRLQAQALDTARVLYTLFSDPNLLNADRLETTRMWRKRLPDGSHITEVRMGWSLWITAVEHQGVEHALELGFAE